MIAHLKGRLLSKSPTASIIDCHGVGYEFFHTPFTSEKLLGDECAVHIHTHLREDALILFGFYSVDERSVFRELLKVSGVGPKLALSILSGIAHAELLNALQLKDLSRLQRIPGIGKKTAERLVLEMGDRVAKTLSLQSSESFASSDTHLSIELESVLLNLGYQRTEIARVMKKLQSADEKWKSQPIEGLVKLALGELTQVSKNSSLH